MSSDNEQSFQGNARVPLVIGVTGHRDLREQDRSQLTEAVYGIFRDLRRDYPHTPLILLSPLAEGADRLVARVALEPDIRARLIVPLPMPQHNYEDDFPTPPSRAEFRDLLQRADQRIELPLAKGNTKENIGEPGTHRNRQYEEVGKYIARQSQILIALWDGLETGFIGGTASIVRFQTEGIPEHVSSALEPPECFPAYHVVTPRVKNPMPMGEPFKVNPLYPSAFEGDDDKAQSYYGTIFGHMEAFNAHVCAPEPALRAEIAKCKARLISGLTESDVPASLLPVVNQYAAADALAIRFQKKTAETLFRLHWTVLLAFLFFVAFAHLGKLLGEHRVWLLVASLGLVYVARVQAKRAKREEQDTKHQDYRALAEGLRVKFFWRLAGLDESVEDHYLGQQRTELDWIRNGFRGWNIGEPRQAPTAAALTDPLHGPTIVLERWVGSQKSYFSGAAEREEKQAKRRERWVSISLKCVLAAAGLLSIGLLGCEFGCPFLGHCGRYDTAVDIWIIVIDLLLAAGALIHHHSQRMAYSEHAKQYSRMEKIFAHASTVMQRALDSRDLKSALEILKKLGKEALAENGDWVLLHRERPLELPHP